MPGIPKRTAAYKKKVDFSLTLETVNRRQQYLLDIMVLS